VIVFHECEKGHGWLTAANWKQHGCLCCERDKAVAEEREACAELADQCCDRCVGTADIIRARGTADPAVIVEAQ
jgi:hypothetical protein